jgi:hypothetical protein
MPTLEIRHQILADGDGCIVREHFGDQGPMEWKVPDRATADALVAERRDMLTKMVADISDEAREAVEDARHIDYLRAGNA